MDNGQWAPPMVDERGRMMNDHQVTVVHRARIAVATVDIMETEMHFPGV